MEIENKIKSLLVKLGISTEDSIVPYFPKVRDRDDVSVLKCNKSDVILLSRSDHINIDYYNKKKDFEYWGYKDREMALRAQAEDTQRRFEQFKHIMTNKRWLDVGTGTGGILDLLSPIAMTTTAVEPQDAVRKTLFDLGYSVYSSVKDIKEENFEIVTLFHTLEHLQDPIDMLSLIRSKMVKGGKIIVEVPHARDFLISFLENDAFKKFTFWSEHSILHTRESLAIFLKKAGFSNIIVKGIQRYPLANHLYWLSHGSPGGHVIWHYLRTEELEKAYCNMLVDIDKTDTIIAIAENL